MQEHVHFQLIAHLLLYVYITNLQHVLTNNNSHHQGDCLHERAYDVTTYHPNVNKNLTDATVRRYLFTAKLIYMFRVSQHPSS